MYEENRSSSESRASGSSVSVGAGGLNVGTNETRSTSITLTDLAHRVAPPKRTEEAGTALSLGCSTAIAGGVIGWMIGGFAVAATVFLLAIAVSTVIAVRLSPDITRRYESALRAWERRYLCLQCGAEIVLEERDGQRTFVTMDGDSQLDALIQARQTIQAVAWVREKRRLDLAEALAVVEAREKELRASGALPS